MPQTRLRTSLLVAAVTLVGVTAWLTHAGETPRPGKLTKAEQAALKPGLTLRFFAAEGAASSADARRVRLAALHVGAGAAASPFIEPGPFRARLSGYVKTSLKGEFSFRVTARGSAVLRINGKEVLKAENASLGTAEAIPLAKGYNRIEIDYASPAKGDATVRVSWSGEGFTTEPLPPDLLFSRADEEDLVVGEERREGRFLFATRGCARCHELPGHIAEEAAAMPELKQRAPSLEDAGRRLEPAWVAQWVLDPRSLRPEARMPQLLRGEAARQQAADLAAYVATLKTGNQPDRDAVQGSVETGEKLFDRLGCIACHRLEAPNDEDVLGRLSLSFVKAKYQAGALNAFLQAPHKHYLWIRMPDFHLDASETSSLTAFLLDRAKGVLPVNAMKGDIQRGAKLFADVGCAQCHDVKAGNGTGHKRRPNPAANALSKGCLAVATGTAPDFGLSDRQRRVLQVFLKTDGGSLGRETPAEFSLRQVHDLQCRACHRRDGQTSRWNQILEDEGLMPEFLPSLTWAGEKLKPDWSVKLLTGEKGSRARPWLKARMPGFPARAELLSIGLSHEHGFAVGEDDRPAADAGLAAIGAKLIQQQGGFSCVMCHAVGGTPAIAPFEAPGINLLDAAYRLRYHYYPRWMIDPPHVDITTRMPKFSQDGKTTPITNVLGGDAFRQYEAIWQYIQTLPQKAGS